MCLTQGVNVGEVVLPPVLWATSGREAGFGVMRVVELARSLTYCNTQESEPSTSPGQQGKALVAGIAGEQVQEQESRRAGELAG